MTAQDRSTLKGVFETGDTPDGSNYADLIDSFLSLAETTAQTVAGKVTFSGGIVVSTVSANLIGDVTGNLTGNVSGQTVTTSALVVTTVTADTVTASAANISGTLTLGIPTTVVAAAGSAAAVPASAHGFLHVAVSGVNVLIPYFLVA